MYMDDIKVFAKIEKELVSLIGTIRIEGQDIGMEFGIEICLVLVRRSGKRRVTQRIELPDQKRIRSLWEMVT